MHHTPPAMVFATVVVLALASFVPSALVLAGVGRSAAAPPDATGPPPPSTRPSPTASARSSSGAVRVVSAGGSSRPVASGQQHEVTFEWRLEGAHEGDDVSVQVYAGNRTLGQTRGSLDPTVFSFSTGVFRLTATLDCSTSGWSAEILTVRGQPIAGASEATVPGVTCP